MSFLFSLNFKTNVSLYRAINGPNYLNKFSFIDVHSIILSKTSISYGIRILNNNRIQECMVYFNYIFIFLSHINLHS